MKRMQLVLSLLATISSFFIGAALEARESQIEGPVLPSALPILGWNRVSPEDLARLREANMLADQDVELLVRGDDPLERGLGIFLLNQRGDLRRLLDAKDLLNDHRQTIPEGMYPDPGYYGVRALPENVCVADYLRYLYRQWLGVECADAEAVREAAAEVENLDHLVKPWEYRFRLAKRHEDDQRINQAVDPRFAIPVPMGAARIIDIKRRVERLPPDIRWVVVAAMLEVDRGRGGEPKFYRNEEATSIFQLAAAELGGRIDPDASPAWSQPGMSPDKFPYIKQAAVLSLQRLAPDVIALRD